MDRCQTCPNAVARMEGGPDAPGLSGLVRFYQERGSVLVVAEIRGVPNTGKTGFLGFHVHEGGSCSGEGFPGTGSHYAPEADPHPNHAGDLPPLMLYGDRAYLAVRTDRFCVGEIIGRTVVIHSGPDDLHSQPAGNAGTKIACGLICKA